MNSGQVNAAAIAMKECDYEERERQHERIAKMTIGERIDYNISQLMGQVEKLTLVRKRLGTAADLRMEDLASSVFKHFDESNPF